MSIYTLLRVTKVSFSAFWRNSLQIQSLLNEVFVGPYMLHDDTSPTRLVILTVNESLQNINNNDTLVIFGTKLIEFMIGILRYGRSVALHSLSIRQHLSVEEYMHGNTAKECTLCSRSIFILFACISSNRLLLSAILNFSFNKFSLYKAHNQKLT